MGKRKIDWLNHLLEFSVVVIGILLAFQLNTCSERKKEDTLVSSHISNILEETTFNKGRITTIQESSKNMIAMIDTLSAAINQPEQLKSKHWLTFRIMKLDYLYLKKNAYNSMVTTGDIRFVENMELQNDVISLYEYYSWAEGYDLMARNVFADYYYPYMMDHMDMMEGEMQEIEVYQSKKFKNILSSYRYSIEGRLDRQKELEKRINEFLEKHQNTKQ